MGAENRPAPSDVGSEYKAIGCDTTAVRPDGESLYHLANNIRGCLRGRSQGYTRLGPVLRRHRNPDPHLDDRSMLGSRAEALAENMGLDTKAQLLAVAKIREQG